jgi:hypothetical protein
VDDVRICRADLDNVAVRTGDSVKLRGVRALITALFVAAPTPLVSWLALEVVVRPRTPAVGVVITLGCAAVAACRVGIEWRRWWLAQAELEELMLLNELADQLCVRGAAADKRVEAIATHLVDLETAVRLLADDRIMSRFRRGLRPEVIADTQPEAGGCAGGDGQGLVRIIVVDAARFSAQQRERHVMPPSVEHAMPSTWPSTTLVDGTSMRPSGSTASSPSAMARESTPDTMMPKGCPPVDTINDSA